MSERVAIVGAGIVGIAHAWREAVRGAQVTLFERSSQAEGASVRNFGMVWPIGQAAEYVETAMESRALWDELIAETGVWSSNGGSLFIAKHRDEWQVLNEFADRAAGLGYRCELLTARQTRDTCPAVTTDSLIGGMFSETELGVDPRQVIAMAPRWLAERYGVGLEFGITIATVDVPEVRSTDGRTWQFDRVTIASGADFSTLYPEVFVANALAKCKLQMMRTGPQPAGWRLGPHIASGLTLRHYASFADCPGLAAVKARIAHQAPELDQFGIHVLAAQNGAGEVVLGDSHEFGNQITPFDNDQITELMLRELRRVIDLPDWSLTARWHGIYAIRPGNSGIQFVSRPADGVTVVIATGGCGMTMSFGLAEQRVAKRHEHEAAAMPNTMTCGSK